VKFIENIRKRLAPNTFTTINEIGTILRSPQVNKPIDPNYWNVSGAMYAYIFLQLTKQGIDVAGESQLVGYPSQFPDVSMMDWETGKPNARYWVLWLLHRHFGPGDKLVETGFKNGRPSGLTAQSMITKKGREVLLINSGPSAVEFLIPSSAKGATITAVDATSGEAEPQSVSVTDGRVAIKPFAVAVLQLQ
jgi:hypothetical protein